MPIFRAISSHTFIFLSGIAALGYTEPLIIRVISVHKHSFYAAFIRRLGVGVQRGGMRENPRGKRFCLALRVINRILRAGRATKELINVNIFVNFPPVLDGSKTSCADFCWQILLSGLSKSNENHLRDWCAIGPPVSSDRVCRGINSTTECQRQKQTKITSEDIFLKTLGTRWKIWSGYDY